MTGARGVLGTVSDKVGSDWKKARCAVSEMIHFINQLQYYILFEVIESSWNELQAALTKPSSTLDDLIQAHAKYLMNITRKGLLGSQSIDFTGQLHELLKTMLAYKDAVDGLYSFSVAEFTRRQEVVAKIETRTAAGKWGVQERDRDSDSRAADSPDPFSTSASAKRSRRERERDTHDSPIPPLLALNRKTVSATAEDDVLPALRKRLGALVADFRIRVNVLLGDLIHQPDHDMRWLAMVMNFNDVYQPVRRRRKGGGGGGGGERERERDRRKEREMGAAGTGGKGEREKEREREKGGEKEREKA